MYQAMISEIAKNKLENFKPSFDEINKKMSPSELLKNSEKFGISGDSLEIVNLQKETKDTLKEKIKVELPDCNEANINKIKGNASEQLMDEYFKKSGWEKVEGEVGVNGIDGLYVKRDKDGNITNVLMSESKYNTSQLGDTKDGKQMSKDWILKKLDNLERAHPDNQDYSQIKELVIDDKYRARLWQVNEVDNTLYITLKKIDSVGNEVSISQLSGNENYKINKIPAIDLKEPIDNYQKSLAMSYDNIVEKVINDYKIKQNQSA
ncbi:hypothetical protein QUR79_03720 [Arcobacter cryaerophilus gv. pseudocryaerophilus]|uniref:Uncharacterized protein n=2 Tax=Arcobacteraceae TaxID=2808963 RepID=A0AAU0P406_9BACT|nr:hypothetical protein RJG54_00395 [Arcobacter sp. AZ-2023]WPD04000.1 hypothetical protein QUR79_03720 [Arcobacter sp. DSM 115972]